MDKEYIKTKRIQLICSFLKKGGGSLKEMLKWVNDELAEQGLGDHCIEKRSLEDCLRFLREGDFQHSLRGEKKHVRKNLFKVIFKNKKYQWVEGIQYPEFGDLENDERFTLPFLAGLLEQYESIPAVQKILSRLPEIFNVGADEMKSSSAVVHVGPMLYREHKPEFQKMLINCVIQILSHLHNGECIQYNYTPVYSRDKFTFTQVIPLQIRFYENYYYLIAKDIKKGSIHNYRVDQIDRLKVEQAKDDEDQFLFFDKEEELKESKIKSLFNDSLGVWVHNDPSQKLHEVHIEFVGWAASYMKHLRFHSSQRILKEDQVEREEKSTGKITKVPLLVISYKLLLSPLKRPGQPATERNYELAFLLGRFRDFARITDARPI